MFEPGPDLLEPPRQLIEMLPVAAYACDARGQILWFNEQAAKLWGRRPRIGDETERFCGSYKLWFKGELTSHDQCPMAYVLRTGDPISGVEAVVERPDGSRVWAMVHIAPIRNAQGTLAGAINCFHDTTALHVAQEELQSRQAELEDFFENSAMGMHIVAADGTILRANKAELALLGYAAEEYIGLNVREIHVDHDTIEDILERLRRGEMLYRQQARLRAKDGSIRHVLITTNANFRDGQLLNTRCVTTDVTQEVFAKQRAAQAEDRFRQLVEALPAAIYTTDAEGRITFYNKAAVQMSGREPELGSDQWCVTWKLYLPDGTPLPHDACPMAVAIRENRSVRGVEAVAERPDGSRVPFIPYPTPLHDEEGKLVGAVNMLVDVSERKQAETQQRLLLDELNHRVKNNIQMLSALLRSAEREANSAEAKLALADASQRVAAMASAQRVLYSAQSASTFNAHEFVHAVCLGAQQTFPSDSKIQISVADGELSNEKSMPLALILNELLTNAVKHGVKGRSHGIIKVRLFPEEHEWVLSVEDDGPGFDFKPPERRSSGLGLVMGLAQQLCGKFEVSRSPSRCDVRFRRLRR